MPNPKSEIRRTGRLPKWSLRLPSMGENMSCMIEKESISQPLYSDALLKSLPISWLINLGRMGIIIPKPMTSSRRVINMNPSAGLCDLDIKVYSLISGAKISSCFLSKELKSMSRGFWRLNCFLEDLFTVFASEHRLNRLSRFTRIDSYLVLMVKHTPIAKVEQEIGCVGLLTTTGKAS